LIERQFSEVTWEDLERLVESGREENDTIEFKRSFKGSEDYAALTDKGREQALDALAREAIAFLNTRGGDIIIGVAETSGLHPKAEALTPVQNPADAADRISRGLSALVEPAQTNINVRAIRDPSDSKRGAILLRIRPSVRAPHRSRRTLECYARRGSESVPMAMDEVQDVTINRNRLRLEQLEFIGHQFTDFLGGKAENRDLGLEVFHIRTVLAPLVEQNVSVGPETTGSMGNKNPVYYDENGKGRQNDVAFRNLYSQWKPILRGKKQEAYDEYTNTEGIDFLYARKVVKESGVCIFDYAARSHYDRKDTATVHSEWIIGYFAEVAEIIRAVAAIRPNLLPAVIRVGLRSIGSVHFEYGTDMWPSRSVIPNDVFFFPDFPIASIEELDSFFEQSQVDLFSLLNIAEDHPYSLTDARSKSAGSAPTASTN
jgi:hypothetical protein